MINSAYFIVGVLTNLLFLIALYSEATTKRKSSFFTADEPKPAEALATQIIGIGIWNVLWLIVTLFFT